MTIREMKNDAVRRISLLDEKDTKTVKSIWLYIANAVPSHQERETMDEGRQKAKELAHSFLGAFASSRTSSDWKEEKEAYLVEKYGGE